MMKLGSLFDGSGGFPLAGALNGITPVWASEIEPYPIRVTKARFPNMKHLGSVLDVKGDQIAPVDIITFGSPCQDLSVAGKQLGIHGGERSNLFFEAIRIIKEMRNATSDQFPRFAIFENVPGAFSSNRGEDFQAVLQAFCEVCDPGAHVPLAPKGKWSHAGCIVGDGYSVAWRVYDAQYWGVPQRRKRIYLIADFASERAGEILFESEGMCGNPAESREAREGTADHAEGCAGGSCTAFHLQQDPISGDISPCIGGQHQATVGVVAAFMGGQGSKARGIGYSDEVAPTIKSVMSGGNTVPDVVYPNEACFCIEGNGTRESHKGDGYAQSDAMYTLNTIERHAVCYDITGTSSNSMKSATPDSCFRERTVGRTLDTFVGSPECNQGGTVVVEAAGFSDALGEKAQGGMEYTEGKSPTLRAGDARSVVHTNCLNPWDQQSSRQYTIDGVYETLKAHQGGRCEGIVYPQVTGALCANSHPGSYTGQDAFNDMLPVVPSEKPPRKYIVRRLTPLECCRLQGFPDWWEQGVEGSDSARYKMWGNGIALPCAADVLRRIRKVQKEEQQHETHQT